VAEGRDEYHAQSHGCRKRNSSKPLKACILNVFWCFSPTEVANGARCNTALVWLLVEVYSVGSSMPSLRLVLFVEEQLGSVLFTPNCSFRGSMECLLSQDREPRSRKLQNDLQCSLCRSQQQRVQQVPATSITLWYLP